MTAQAEHIAALEARLTTLAAENRRLRAEAARHRRSPTDGFHVGYHRFVTHADYTALTESLGYGNDRDEPAAEPRDLIDPLTDALADGREHQECPEWCDECSQWEAPRSCSRCHGSGCLPNAALAYLECGDCAGDGREHVEHRLDGTPSPDTENRRLRTKAANLTQQVRQLRAMRDAGVAWVPLVTFGEKHGCGT